MYIEDIYDIPIIKVEVCSFDEIRIHFGSMINMFNARINKTIYRGEYLLHIVDAAWRLRKGSKIIFSSNCFEEEMIKKFCHSLEGKRVTLYNDTTENDFHIILDNDMIFETFFYNLDIDEPVKWLIDKPDGSTYYHIIKQEIASNKMG